MAVLRNVPKTFSFEEQRIEINEIAQDLYALSSGNLTQFSVTVSAASGSGNLSYDNTTGVFDYTPPDLSGYSTFSGSYNDLTDQPTLFSGDYNDLSNQPTLFSGDYNDLTNKPTTLVSSINDLSDVTTGTTSTNDVLTWNGSVWAAVAPSGGGSSSLTGLSDVTLTNLQAGEILKWNGSDWVNATDATGAGGAEADTLDTVTGRGSVTTNNIEAARIHANGILATGPTAGSGGTGTYVSVVADLPSGASGYNDMLLQTTSGGGTVTFCTLSSHNTSVVFNPVHTFSAGGLTYPNSNGNSGEVLTSDGAGNVTWQNAATSEWSITSNGSSDYRFTGPGFDGTENDPTIYLVRGQQYKFTNNSGGSHPFQIRTAIDGTAYNDGITNNGLSSGTLTWDIQMDAPNILYYQCTAHAGMVGKILIPNLGDGDNVSVQDFGAVGNGVVDDTTAIQDAIDSGAKHLTFPSGTYKLSSTINITSELHVSAKGAKFVQTDNATMFNFNVTSSANVYSLLSSYRIGVPTAVTIAAGGSGYAATGTAVATTSTGTGAFLTVDFTATAGVIDSVTINTAGRRYVVGETITITGGDGNATFTITSTTNSDTLELSSTPSSGVIKPGDAIKITSEAVDRCQRDNGTSSSLYRVGEWAIVKSVSGSTITLTMPLKEVKGVDPIYTDNNLYPGEESIVDSYELSFEPKVIVLPRTSMSWVGGELAFAEGHDSTDPWSKPVFKCSGYTNPKFSKIVITRGYQHGISLTGTVHAIIKDCSISNLTNNTSQSQYGYGVATAGTFKTLVDGCTFANTRHGFTTSSRSYQWITNTNTPTTSQYLGGGRDQSGMVVNCYGDGNNDNSVFDTHMCAQDYVFNNCVVDGAESGFAIRGRNVTVSNCKTFNVNRGILAHTEYANSASNSDAWANDKNHMTSVRINDCEFNAYNYPMHMKALTSCDITDVVANAGQPTVLFVEGCKVNLHGTNTFAVSNFHGTKDANSVNDKGMITVTGSTSLASYIDPGIFVSPGSYLRLDGTLATSDSNDLSIFHFNSGYSHSIVNDGKISIKLSTAIRYIRNAVDNCTFSGQGELMWESTNKHSSFATNFIGTSTDTTKWAYIDAYEIGDDIRHYWKDKRPKTVFSNVPEKLTFNGAGVKVDNAFILPSQHMRWANQLTGGEVVKHRFNIDQPDNTTATYEIRLCGGYVHDWSSSAGRQEVEITAIMPSYRTQTIYIRIIEGDQAAGDTNVYAIVKDKTIAGGFSSNAQEAGAVTLSVTAGSGITITLAPIETTVSRLSINVP